MPCYILALFVLVELTEVAFLLEELIVVVPAIETVLMGYIVRWAYHTPTMAAPEASFMVRSSIDRHLKRTKSRTS